MFQWNIKVETISNWYSSIQTLDHTIPWPFTYIKAIFDIEALSSMDITPTPKSWESILLFVSSQWILMNFDRTQYFLNERPDKSLSGKHAMIFFITSITLYHAKQKSSHDKLSSHSNHYASQTKIIKPQPKQKSLVIHS